MRSGEVREGEGKQRKSNYKLFAQLPEIVKYPEFCLSALSATVVFLGVTGWLFLTKKHASRKFQTYAANKSLICFILPCNMLEIITFVSVVLS